MTLGRLLQPQRSISRGVLGSIQRNYVRRLKNLAFLHYPSHPEMIERQKMFARIELRNLKRSGRDGALTDDNIKSVSQKLSLSVDLVQEQALEVEAENKPP